jgi:hypothetical protein
LQGMYPSEWAGQRVETLAQHHRIVWVEDPYRLISESEAEAIRSKLAPNQISVFLVNNAWNLRKALAHIYPESARLVLIDQSYRLREPHLAPRDAKPADLIPLKAPDWKPLVPAEAQFRPTIRDFLVYATDEASWPPEVNIYPYEELARRDPEGFVAAFDSYRKSGKTLTSQDLLLVGASAAFGINLVDLTDPMLALELAFHGANRWRNLETYFNKAEIETIRRRLSALPRPLGDLFGENVETARQALVALIILSQHVQPPDFEEPGQLLPLLSPALVAYSDCPAMQVSEAPSWFIEEEVLRFEKLLTKTFMERLHERLGLSDQERARQFWERERFSSRLRQLAVGASDLPRVATHAIGRPDDFSLSRLVPQFRATRQQLENVVRVAKGALDKIRLTPPRSLTLEQFFDVFDRKEAYRIDSLLGALNGLISDIEGPARREWEFVPGFEQRWDSDVRACRDLMNRASRLRDDLDFEFGRLLEARYSELVPDQAITTGRFYERFIGPRRRTTDGRIQPALILVIDSMRLDIWRRVIRPALEGQYEVEETLGLAELPSETAISRACFFAGQRPGDLRPGLKETETLAETLRRVHDVRTTFVESSTTRAGMRYLVHSSDGKTSAGVFDFPDVLSHRTDWDRNVLDEALKPFVREILALLQEAGKDTLVFVTADHGHYRREGGSPVYLDGATDVGYRSAWIPNQLTDDRAKHLFQIKAEALGHNRPGYFVFPRPGFHLRSRELHNSAGRASASYRHGGISMAEVIVPLACLRHRLAPVPIRLSVQLRDQVVVGRSATILVSVSADGQLRSPIRLTADSPDVEPLLVDGADTTPRQHPLKILASSPGLRKIKIQAWIGEKLASEALLDIDVVPAPVAEDEAKLKLKKLWGDD